jgi:prolyl 4-hydroxylase
MSGGGHEVELAAQAAADRERLLARPGAVRIPATGMELFGAANFLGEAECEGLIAMIDLGRKPSRVMDGHPDPEFRTSESCDLPPRDRLVQAIEAKLAELVGLDPAFGETIQGQRYAVGQQFKPHHDFFSTGKPHWQVQKLTGGQRTWTAMIFLNTPEEGGHTLFPRAQVKVAPRRGNLLVWNNLDEAGEPNLQTLHQGMPVIAGVKYIVTKWYRERRWTPQAARAAAPPA